MHILFLAALDLVLSGGRVVDGSGAPWFRADVGIEGDRVVAVGDLSKREAKRRIDVGGAMVAPGFIDLLGQSELAVLVDNRVESKIRQGITSEITGEGNSVAPLGPVALAEMKPWLDQYHLTVDWTDLEGYWKHFVRTGSAVNLGTFVGAAQVRTHVLGLGDVQPTAAQLAQMEAEVEKAMKQGALGVSTSLIYPPGSYARTPELVALAKVAARHGGIYATHMRSEDAGQQAALDEVFTIAKEARIPVEIWHLKSFGKANWGKLEAVLQRIEKARSDGLDITGDMYPYVAAMNNLSSNVPEWAQAGGADEMLKRFADPATRARIVRDMKADSQLRSVGPENILLASCIAPSLKKYMGKRLSDVARLMGRSPEEALLDLVTADRGQTSNILFGMNEDDVQRGLKRPWVAFDTDANGQGTDGPFAADMAHPRAFGAAPRLIGHYARDLGLFSIEEAVRRMTSLPARRVGLRDRGLLRPGMAADVVVFDPARLRDVATFENPNRYSEGVRWVVVNGQLVLDDGKLTSARPGRPLRRN
jgi:N-acyl-D-amino-acid deacylase